MAQSEALQRYMSASVYGLIGAGELNVGVTEPPREVAVLTSVLRKRESHMHAISSQEEFDFLNHLYGELVPPIHKYDGRVDLFLPDEARLTAVFGGAMDPSDNDYSVRAVRAALEMSDAIAGLNVGVERPLDVTIGIATGEALIGYIGTSERTDYRVVGPAANIALLLATEGRDWGEILVNDSAREQAGESIEEGTKEFKLYFGEQEVYFSVLRRLYEG